MQVSCPYCNAVVSLTEVPSSGRADCPRCGEAFPVRPPADDTPPLYPNSSDGRSAEAPRPVPESGPAGRSLRPLALLGAALGLIVLGVGLYVVYHYPGGRATDPTDPGAPKAAATVPPAVLPGLAYLPAETGIAFAVQPGPIAAHAERAKTDQAPGGGPGPGPSAWVELPNALILRFERLGLQPHQIGHVVGGLTLTGGKPLNLVVALVLREPVADRANFLKNLKATQMTAASGQVRYNVTLERLAMTMANPDPRTYLFALDPATLDAPARTGPPDAHLPAGLRESLGRLSPASLAWVATDADDWAANPGLKVLATLGGRPDLPARLQGVRAAAVGVSLEPEPRLTASVRAADPDAAPNLRARVTDAVAGREQVRLGGEGPWVTVEGPPAADAWAGLEALLPKPAGK